MCHTHTHTRVFLQYQRILPSVQCNNLLSHGANDPTIDNNVFIYSEDGSGSSEVDTDSESHVPRSNSLLEMLSHNVRIWVDIIGKRIS